MIKIKLVALLAVLILVSSCSDDPAVRIRYHLEKGFHQAEKMLEEAKSFETVLSDQQLAELIPVYNDLVQQCYQAFDSIDSELSPVEANETNYITYQAASRLSQLYFANKDFDKSLSIYQKLLESKNLTLENEMMTYINLAQTYQTYGKWVQALEIYNLCIEKYYPPLLNSGNIIFPVFNMPSNIYRQYVSQGDKNKADNEFDRAEKYYIGLVQNFPKSKLDIASRANLARLYDDSQQWHKALEQLSYLEDSNQVSYSKVLLKKGEIYSNKLNDYDNALLHYNKIFDLLPADDSLIGPVVNYHISLVKLNQGEFDDARRILNETKKKYPYVYDASPKFIFTYARSFELSQKWKRAETEYNLLIEKYRGSEEAMTALLYITDYYRARKREIEYEKNFNRALEYYLHVASINKGNPYEASGLIFAADLYARDENWEKSCSYLMDIYQKFSDNDIGHKALSRAIAIYRNKIKDTAKADSLSIIYNISNNPVQNSQEIKDLLN